MRGNISVTVRRNFRRPSLAKQLSRRVDAVITNTQEWLEGEDKPSVKVMGYGLLVITGIFLAGQVVRQIIL